jgi:hypothetical protein
MTNDERREYYKKYSEDNKQYILYSQRHRYDSDPDYKEKTLSNSKERQKRIFSDPELHMLHNEKMKLYMREYRKRTKL